MYSSALWERAESPGPSLTASQGICIQSDDVGEEMVSRPRAAMAWRSGESGAVAEARCRRLRACRWLWQMPCNSSRISFGVYNSLGRMSTTKRQRSGMTLWAVPERICVTFSRTSPISGETRVNLWLRSFAMSSIAR